MSSDQPSMVVSQETETMPGKITVSYKECRRNHAVSIGSHAVDGCCEFSPTGEQGTEQGFLGEACGCHRSFHPKEVVSNGRVHRAAPPPAPPSSPPVEPVGGYVTLPFVVLHPVDYNSLSQHHDPMQNENRLALDGRDPRMEQRPNSIKRPQMEPF